MCGGMAPVVANARAPDASSAREQSQRHLSAGDAALADNRIDDAVTSYRAAYDALDADDRSGYPGSIPLRKAMRAYDRLTEAESDPTRRRELLEAQRALLDTFLGGVAKTPGAEQDLGEDLVAELEQTRAALDDALQSSLEPEPEPETSAVAPDERQPVEVGPVDAGPVDTRLPLGLVIGGSVLFASGVGVSVGYFTIRRGARSLVDASPDFAVGTPERAAYLQQEDGRARKFLIAGSVVAAAGLATAIGGTILWVARRRTPPATSLRWSPILSPAYAGASLGRRF